MKSFSNLEIEGEPLKISDDFELETQIRLWRNLVKNQWTEVLKICQENWKALNIPITNTNDTVLHLAAYNKLEQEFELLLQILPSERDVKTKVLLVKNTEGNTPLHFAASVGSVRMCQSIINITGSETSLSARNKEDETPLFIAALHGHKNAFLYLHFCGQKDGNNYFRRNDGETVLHCAISGEYFELSLTILSLYRDLVNLANMDGMTPLHFLASKPAAFESGSDLRWFEKIIYQSIAKTDELELLTEVERAIQQYSREVLDRKEEWKEDLKVIREIIKEDLDQFSLGGLVSRTVLYISGSEMIRKLGEMKKRHTRSLLIMKVLLHYASMRPFPQEQETEKEHVHMFNPILIAAKNGITEMVEKSFEISPMVMNGLDQDRKNIVLLTVEHKQPHVYELLLDLKKKEVLKDNVFGEVDSNGDSALHFAAKKADFIWPVPGAASQMQWDIKWYEYINNTTGKKLIFVRNKKGKTPDEVFTEEHEELVKEGGKWLSNTSNACSVVAGLFVTVTFTSSSTVPDSVKQVNKDNKAYKILAGSSFVSFCASLVAVVMFLAILTSGYRKKDFRYSLLKKLLLGLTAFYVSIASTLISFCSGHFSIFKDVLKSAASPSYLVVCLLLITFFAFEQLPLYVHLLWATFKKVPQRNYRFSFPRLCSIGD